VQKENTRVKNKSPSYLEHMGLWINQIHLLTQNRCRKILMGC